MSDCTEFCTRLKAIGPTDGAFPSHDELVAKLQFTVDDREIGRCLGTWRELQQRTECGFCQLVVAAVASHGNLSDTAPDQPISVLIFPGEQSFRLSYPSRVGVRLAFVARDGGGPKPGGPDTARPVDESNVDVSMISRWLRSCDENHEGCQPEPFEPLPQTNGNRRRFNEEATSNFRVIDLELGCVRPAALHVRYVALSYVWGHLPMFRLQRENMERLSAEGSLDAIRDELPRTISDAIDLVKALGERYLWVDGLCLVQDDEDDVSMGIEQMNSIYHGSYLTIVAASGADAGAGLPGSGAATPREHRQIVRDVSGGGPESLRMAVLHSIDWHLRRSVYGQRAWTLQEIVLPRRTAIFVNGQVYFRCREANWSEDSWADAWTRWLDADDSNISRIPDPGDGFMPSFWAYQKLCEDYSSRALRSNGDALRAAVGFLRPLAAGMETMLIEGLPGYYLEHFLLFISPGGDLRRRAEFASFSWAGWAGAVTWPRENYVWHETNGERTWDPVNVVKFFKHKRLVEWRALNSSAHYEDLSFRPWDKPSLLVELMRQHPAVFPGADVDPERDHKAFPVYNTGGGGGGAPHWDANYYSDMDARDLDVTGLKPRPKDQFSIKVFDLANGEAEFRRLVGRLHDIPSLLSLQNWMAQRHCFTTRVGEDKSRIRPRSVARGEEPRHYRFRERNSTAPSRSNSGSQNEDRREEQARFWSERRALKQEDVKAAKPFPIPTFPPYTVLQFITISMHLVLGTSPQRAEDERPGLGIPRPTRSLYDRIPGIPLHSATGQVVGSLHPDNVDLLGPPGSKVECLIVSRCTTPTVASALYPLGTEAARYGGEEDRPWDLFWVLAVVWRDEIAERRGVGQVLVSALETAVEPAPEVKMVLLG